MLCCCCCCLWEISLVLVWQSRSDHKPLEMIHLKNLTAVRPVQGSRECCSEYKDMTSLSSSNVAQKCLLLARPNPLPSEESLDLRKVVQFLDEKFNALKQDTSSNPELQLYSGWPKNITKLQCWVSTGPTGMNCLLKTVWSSIASQAGVFRGARFSSLPTRMKNELP